MGSGFPKVLKGPKNTLTVADKKEFIEDVRRALYCSKMISYAQGYMLLRAVEKEMKWNLNMGGIALMWRGGCIIRSVFLGDIKKAFDKNPKLENLLMDEFSSGALSRYQASWRKAIIHPAIPRLVCLCRRLLRRCRFMMATGARAAAGEPAAGAAGTSLARIRMNGWISRGGSSSTRTGRERGGRCLLRRTTLRVSEMVKEPEV